MSDPEPLLKDLDELVEYHDQRVARLTRYLRVEGNEFDVRFERDRHERFAQTARYLRKLFTKT